MPTLYPLTFATTLASLRIDLSDTVLPYRWQDSDLSRAIDKANERYSWANPLMQSIQVPTVALTNIYPCPPGTFFIDKVEYPVGYWPKSLRQFLERRSPLIASPSFPAGSILPSASFAPGGHLSTGQYFYAFSFTTPGGGETPTSPPVGPFTAAINQQAILSNIPLGNYGVTGRNIYRTVAGGSSLFAVASIPDNQTTTLIEGLADGSLVVPAPTMNATAGIDLFELQIPPELWPPDTTQLLEITYASKHELDTAGTTLPERHWDVLFLGALAYAMWAYLPQVNDNFEYADGHLRDRVDDTKSAIAWHTQQQRAMADFEQKIKLVKEEANASIAQMTYWGDKPIRYERL